MFTRQRYVSRARAERPQQTCRSLAEGSERFYLSALRLSFASSRFDCLPAPQTPCNNPSSGRGNANRASPLDVQFSLPRRLIFKCDQLPRSSYSRVLSSSISNDCQLWTRTDGKTKGNARDLWTRNLSESRIIDERTRANDDRLVLISTSWLGQFRGICN